MHLAISKKILERVPVKDENRFLLGILLPDGERGPQTKKSHFEIEVWDGARKTYDLTRFRDLFGDRLLDDELYLGYYLHLIQDMVYRPFMYMEYHWKSSVPGNVPKLHNDYRLLNTYVIEAYQLDFPRLVIPDDFYEEDINRLFPPDVDRILMGLKSDYVPYHEGSIYFFTQEMAEEYIRRTVEICLHEIRALKEGLPLMAEMEHTWVQW